MSDHHFKWKQTDICSQATDCIHLKMKIPFSVVVEIGPLVLGAAVVDTAVVDSENIKPHERLPTSQSPTY